MKIKVKKLWNIFIDIITGFIFGVIGVALFMALFWFFTFTLVGNISLLLLMIAFFGHSFVSWFKENRENDL